MNTELFNRIKLYCEKHHIIERQDKILAGLSGGADSIFLVRFLKELADQWHLEIGLVHVNHGIRGSEADRDEAFSVEIARNMGLPIQVFHDKIPQLATEWKMSEEEAGRVCRYRRFEQVREEWDFDKTAVAHHQDDQAETLLFQMLRGSSLRGLGGMRPERERIIRPLLSVSKKEIETALIRDGISWCTDSTNLEDLYSRNRLRHQVIPCLEEFAPGGLVPRLSQTAGQLQDIFDYIQQQTNQAWKQLVKEKDGYSIGAAAYQKLHTAIQRELAIMLLERTGGGRKNLTFRHIESFRELAAGSTGKRIDLPYRMQAGKDYDILWVRQREPENSKADRPFESENGLYWNGDMDIDREFLLDRGSEGQMRICLTKEKRKLLEKEVPKNNCTKWFDYARIKGILEFRHPQERDYFQLPDGGHKRLSRFLIDRKLPLSKRESVWVLAMGHHILWIPEWNRTSAGFYVDGDTEIVLCAKYELTQEKGQML